MNLHSIRFAASAALMISVVIPILMAQSGSQGNQASSTVLATTANSATVGAALRLTATVSPSSVTGKIVLYDGAEILATRLIAGSGTVTFSISPQNPGKRAFRAVYLGDLAFARSESNTVSLTVNTNLASTLQSIPTAPQMFLPAVSTLATADFNGDGFSDLAVSNQGLFGRGGTDQITVYLGNGKGNFALAPRSPISVGRGPQGIASGDFNGDSRADLVVAHSDGSIYVLLGNGLGQFENASGSPIRFGNGFGFLTILDLNRDGFEDLALTQGSGLIILTGLGNGTFLTSSSTPANLAVSYGIRSGDFDGNGWADLAVVNGAPLSNVVIFFNNGLSSFIQRTIPVAANPNYMTVGDWNGDGRTDLATVGSGNEFVNVILMLPGGPKVQQINPTPRNSRSMISIEPLDFDGDGDLDLITGAISGPEQPGAFGILLGDGKGDFQPFAAGPWGNSISPRSMAIADLNADGRQDIVVANDYFSGPGILSYFALSATKLTASTASTPQSARINTVFQQPLQVNIVDEMGNPISGIPVTYTFPPASTSQPGITQADSTVLTGSSPSLTRISSQTGLTELRVTANSVSGGPYQVVASSPGLPNVVFSLTNLSAGAASTISLTASSTSSIQGELVTLIVTLSPPGNGTAVMDILDGEEVFASSAGFTNRLLTQVTTLRLGARTLTARYRGDNSIAPSRSVPITHTVRPASGTPPVIAASRGVVNGASLLPGLAPGAWMTIYGANLAATTRVWEGKDFNANSLPTQLDGVRVTVDGTPAYVYFISPNQINFLAPKVSPSNLGQIQVLNSTSASNVVRVDRNATSPAFFAYSSLGPKYIIAQDAQDFSLIAPPNLLGPNATTVRAKRGQSITLYATGLGETNPPYPDGQLPSTAALIASPQVTIGGFPAPVTFAGLIGPGLYQINLVVPQQAFGDAETIIRIGPISSPAGFNLSVE
jgi:uncharacterized protein (TIGR03437 family)